MEHDLRELMTTAFTADQRDVLALRQSDQDRTSEAIDQLNTALIAAASGREAVWRRNVADALEILHQAVTTESRVSCEADGLLGDIARTQPRLRNRVRGLRHHYARLSRQIDHTLRTSWPLRVGSITVTAAWCWPASAAEIAVVSCVRWSPEMKSRTSRPRTSSRELPVRSRSARLHTVMRHVRSMPRMSAFALSSRRAW